MHNDSRLLGRRDFLRRATAAAAGAFSGARALGQTGGTGAAGLPRRRLGRTGVEISTIVVGELPDLALTQRAVDLGVNYFHKVEYWATPEFLAKLDRDSFYCDAVVQTLDYDGAVAQFEWFCKKTGLERIDFFKVHSLFGAPEDVLRADGIYRAFDDLKRQGRCDYLAVAQHGRPDEILTACIDSGRFDAIQPPFNVMSPPEVGAMIERARAADVGVIAKKVLCGGKPNWERQSPEITQRLGARLGPGETLPKALIKSVLDTPGVTAVVPLATSFEQLEEDIAAAVEATTATERAAVEGFRREMAGGYCAMCGTCVAGCPRGVAVADVLRYAVYAEGYREPDRARGLYAKLPPGARPSSCADCGRCESVCPRGLPVRRMLREAEGVLA
jgi:uncharacterized protein